MNDLTNAQKIAAFKQGLFDRGETLADYCRQHDLDYDAMQMVLQGRTKGRSGNAHKVYVALGLTPAINPTLSQINSAPAVQPHRSFPMNETGLFPDALRVSRELDWVYTSSSRVAQVFGLPHQEVVERITTLSDQLVDLGDEIDVGVFRYGLLTYQGRVSDGDFEILISQDLFWLLATGFEGEAAAQWKHMVQDEFDQEQRELVRLRELLAAQA